VAPAVLVYSWGFGSIERVGWLAAFLFVVCGALRLARFNVQRNVVDSRFFVGLPIPAAAAQVAAWVNLMPAPLSSRSEAAIALALTTVWAFLMVSTFRYRSFKKLDLRSRRSYITVLGIALLFLLVALEPRVVLLVMATAYWLSAPVIYVAGLGRRRRDGSGSLSSSQEQTFSA
jgi:CDP-diacylglycerol--serine O-phosphatidyltransferase